MSTRNDVIEAAVQLEQDISLFLCSLLNIDPQKNISFGNKSQALSFNAKVNLLNDLDYIPKEAKPDFQLFSEIRNKFAHVKEVDSFVSYFKIANESSDSFIKKYGKGIDKEYDEEITLQTCFFVLNFNINACLYVANLKLRNNKIQEMSKTTMIDMLDAYIKFKEPKEATKEEELFYSLIKNHMKTIGKIEEE